jgi:hypothetical protein
VLGYVREDVLPYRAALRILHTAVLCLLAHLQSPGKASRSTRRRLLPAVKEVRHKRRISREGLAWGRIRKQKWVYVPRELPRLRISAPSPPHWESRARRPTVAQSARLRWARRREHVLASCFAPFSKVLSCVFLVLLSFVECICQSIQAVSPS